MSARANILNRIRKACPGGKPADRPEQPSVPVVANAIAADRETLISVFIQRARESGATVRTTRTSAELNDALAALHSVTPLATPDARVLAEFPHLATAGGGDADGHCMLVRADAGIAETGTVCLHSGQVASRALFLCEQLAVLLDDVDIVRYQEDYWRRQPADTPRALHLITGPSRTADVEQTIQIGAHGPRSVTILLTLGQRH